MRKNLIKKLTAVIVFIVTIVVVDFLMNSGNTEMTMEMPQATLPVVSIITKEHKINTMYGYREKREEIHIKENITPITKDREITIAVEPYGNMLKQISYEVRSTDGERLIERSDVKVTQRIKNETRFSIQLKDLTDENTEYTFVTILTMQDGRKVYYYTRFIEKEEFYVKEKIDFVLDFHETTFGDTDGEEIKKYLESSSKGDNSSFNRVNINSSLQQVMWADLRIKKEGEPQIFIKDISESTAMITLNYPVKIQKDSGEQKGFVEEYYRIRYTPERMYLLDFERKLEEVFEPVKENLQNEKMVLGITDKEVLMKESEGGTNLAFINTGRLFSYNSNDSKLTEVFSFYKKGDTDPRNINRNFKIDILNIEDSGNITFAILGYMNRGIHEGEVGIVVYYYKYMENTIEELVYIPYYKSADILIKELEKLLYLNVENHLYFLLEGNLFDIDIQNKSYDIVKDNLTEGRYTVSESGRMICWLTGDDPYLSKNLEWFNLSSQKLIKVQSSYSEYIKPMGFMGEDLIYGLAKQSKIKREQTGNILFPIDKVIIKNEEGETLKQYNKEGVYVVDCHIEDNQLTLNRVKEKEDGTYVAIENDHITSNDTEESNLNTTRVVTKEKYKSVVEIVLKNTINTAGLKIKNPKEVIFEEERKLLLEIENEERFYVYGPYGMEKITSSPADAIIKAEEISGTVVDEKGKDIWRKEKIFTKNQIMAVTGKKKEANTSSLATCLDVILELEGISRKTQSQLEQGETAFQILSQGLREEKILNLTGCSLDAVLYYIDRDIPVLALKGESEVYLIVGFNEQNIVLMDPESGTVFKKGMNDSREMFEETGNQFITYLGR